MANNNLKDQEQTIDANEQIEQRKKKLAQLREQGIAYPNDFQRDALAADLLQKYDELSGDELEAQVVKVKVAGRMLTRRIMGKASFAHIQDMSGRLQLYVARDSLAEGVYSAFKHWDLGDIIGAEGILFRTKTGELSVKVSDIRLLTKSLRPMPDKFHGLHDQEQRFRQRYLDLIANEEVRQLFKIRSQIVMGLRQFLVSRGFMEVETPMMQAQAGGASARPFMTHHNALDMPLYMRVAPELYLKRLVVGGFEKVFELNRNFRNEGVSTRHNPEFTMLEFYQAYATYEDMMDLTEELFKTLAQQILETTKINYQGAEIDFSKPFARLTLVDAILKYSKDVKSQQLNDLEQARALAQQLKIDVHPTWGLGKLQMEIFEQVAEEKLIQPTFIIQYPAEVSPLARANNENEFITDRFELYIGGREIANAFSELNDPEDQARRFQTQLKAKQAGDIEAMAFDEDYITALEYGLPPTAGEGIGVDRLVMLFTDSSSIRDVILFPLLRVKSESSV